MYKTIVVHLDSTAAMRATLDVAASIANQMGAHLVGTTASGIAELNYVLAVGAPIAMMPAADIEQLRQDAEQRLAMFRECCRERGVASFETRLLDTTAADALLLQSRYSDLLVAGTDDLKDDGLLLPAGLPGRLVTQAARPVLLVPRQAPADARFNKIMIAWNGSPGVSRLIALAMPFILRAKSIVIAVCNPELERIDLGAEPGADLATYLARHHGNVQVVRHGSNEETDAALAGLAGELRADLMLAGAFGHSRLHDWVLGGTTSGLIARTRIPLLMTH
ncbi:universal stress protein [Pseudoduganella ginsengisoli]|uniref:Universal stress protein n=1 Tax=Pseudoduganella ginsengisoli TaxID=1462440 RepID=A0A6L6PWA0_9BURK|nr:universal stress protein [Pseudoduganella ginsengisoli]MTW01730.1 universal stress protein [Pseudoduganella ginsengisoli]